MGVTSLYEEINLRQGTYEKALADEVYDIIAKYKHANKCRLYHNMGYVCESLARIKNRNRSGRNWRVTIHDVVTFLCSHCGHGHINKRIMISGEVKDISNFWAMDTECTLYIWAINGNEVLLEFFKSRKFVKISNDYVVT